MFFPHRCALLVLVLAPAVLPACSIPKFDPAQAPPPQTVDQLIEANHYRRALAQLTSNPAANPTPAEAAGHALLLSRVELGLGQLEPALQTAEKALATDPNNAAFHVQVAAVAGRMAERASMFKQLTLAKRVKKELDEAYALNPKNADAVYGLMLFAEVAPSFLGGDKTKAQKFAEQLTALDGARGYLAQAQLAHDRKDAVAEESFLNKAIAANGGSYETQIAYATWAKRTEPARLDAVDEHACEALYIDPTRAEAWQIIAELAAGAECLPEIDGLIWAEQQFNPDDLSPAYAASVVLLTGGKRLDEARTLLKQYLEKPQEGNTPSAGMARYHLAMISEKQGRPEEALDLMRIAVNEDPTLADAKKSIKRLEQPTHPE